MLVLPRSSGRLTRTREDRPVSHLYTYDYTISIYKIMILIYKIRFMYTIILGTRRAALSLSLSLSPPPPLSLSLPFSLSPPLSPSLPGRLAPWRCSQLDLQRAPWCESMRRIRARMGKWSTGANECREHVTRRAVTLHALRAGFPPRGQTNGP